VSTFENDMELSKPLTYMDLLLITLTEHEKRLSAIIEKLEAVTDKLEEINQLLIR
jgi:uncharacterized coiled-coil protein SlyX